MLLCCPWPLKSHLRISLFYSQWLFVVRPLKVPQWMMRDAIFVSSENRGRKLHKYGICLEGFAECFLQRSPKKFQLECKITLPIFERIFLCVGRGAISRQGLCSPYYAGASTCVASQVLILKGVRHCGLADVFIFETGVLLSWPSKNQDCRCVPKTILLKCKILDSHSGVYM